MTEEPEETGATLVIEEQPRLLSVELGGSPGLGGNASFTLGERRTVLIGHNGAGKSLLLEGFASAVEAATGKSSDDMAPRFFRCEIARPSATNLAYEYHRGTAADPTWRERCWTTDDGAEVWRIEGGTLFLRGGHRRDFAPGRGGLLATNSAELPAQPELLGVRELLRGIVMVPGNVRGGGERREILLASGGRDAEGKRRWPRPSDSRDEALAWAIVRLWERERKRYNEFVELLRMLEVVRELTVMIYEDVHVGPSGADPHDYASVLFDGVNVGYCSDGTQRVADILLTLLGERRTGLILKEPETSLHPSLLGSLLAVIESYSLDRQLILSTHAPQVVDWCAPRDLRIVERAEGKAAVAIMPREELERAQRYVSEVGRLSDFIGWRS